MWNATSDAQTVADYWSVIAEVGRVNVYGAGAFGRALTVALDEAGIDVEFLIDRSVTSGDRDRFQVVRPGSVQLDPRIPVLLSVMGYPEIKGSLEADGFATVVATELVFELFPRALQAFTTDGFLWRSVNRELQIESGGLAALEGLLKDEKSRYVLKKLVAFRLSPSRETYPWPDSYEWYFPTDVPFYSASGSISVIDCGAYDGDTLRVFLKRFPERVTDYLAIEANPENAAALINWVNENASADQFQQAAIRVANIAVSSQRGDVLLSDNGTASTRVIDTSVTPRDESANFFKVVAAPIDEVADGVVYTHIKMDIEGAEYEALKGASTTIREQHPALAISVYHGPDDLWRLPLLVESIAPGAYDYYLRLEGHWGLETMCYAVPR